MSVAGLPVVAEIVRSGFVEGHHYGSVVALAADGTVDWSVGEVVGPGAAAVEQQAAPGPRDGRARPRPPRRAARTGVRLALRRALPRRGRTPHAGVRRPRRVGAADPADYPLDDDAREAVVRAGGREGADPDELLGQARGDARDLRAAGLGHRHLPRPRPPAAGRDRRHLRPAHRRAGRRRSPSTAAARPLLSTSLTGLARAFASLATATDGPQRRVADADPPPPRVRQRHHPRRARPAPGRPRADRQGRAPSPATPSRSPTAAPGRSRPTTAPRAYARC